MPGEPEGALETVVVAMVSSGFFVSPTVVRAACN